MEGATCVFDKINGSQPPHHAVSTWRPTVPIISDDGMLQTNIVDDDDKKKQEKQNEDGAVNDFHDKDQNEDNHATIHGH